MSEWKACKLGNVANYVTGKLNSNAAVPDGSYPFFTCSPETLRIDNYAFDMEALILAGNNADGVFSLKYYAGKFNAYQRTYIITIIDEKVTDYKYLFYSLKTQLSNLETISHGTATKYLTLPILNDIPILSPSLPEQRAIAGVLSSLDDKIDLLHRQNKTLEGMAEALWRKMFVEEADPEWKKGKLGDLIELHYGKGLKEEKRIPGKYPVVGSSGIVGYHNDFLVKGPGIVIGRKGTLGVVNYIEENFFPIDTTYFIKSKTNSGRLFFEYFLLKKFSFEEMNSDSAVPGLNREIAQSMELSLPPIGSILKFDDFCEPLFIKKMKNISQIRTLSRMRDTLLPKLMSGAVRVRL